MERRSLRRQKKKKRELHESEAEIIRGNMCHYRKTFLPRKYLWV